MVAEDMPDLVILDAGASRSWTGLDVLRALRADPATRDLPVIVTHAAQTRSHAPGGTLAAGRTT